MSDAAFVTEDSSPRTQTSLAIRSWLTSAFRCRKAARPSARPQSHHQRAGLELECVSRHVDSIIGRGSL